jgi:hypothetical protein
MDESGSGLLLFFWHGFRRPCCFIRAYRTERIKPAVGAVAGGSRAAAFADDVFEGSPGGLHPV